MERNRVELSNGMDHRYSTSKGFMHYMSSLQPRNICVFLYNLRKISRMMEVSSNGRFYINRLPIDGLESQDVATEVLEALKAIRSELVDFVTHIDTTGSGIGVYTGALGILYVLDLYDSTQRWKERLRGMRDSIHLERPTLLSSDLLLFVQTGDYDNLRLFVQRARSLPHNECEVMNGRAGCLSGLLLARRFHPELKVDGWITQLVDDIVQEGTREATGRFTWSWHSKEYLGAIHGIAGILFVLLRCNISDSECVTLQRTVDYILSDLSLPSGNVPSSVGNGSDKLVHFCHGATGWIPLVCLMISRFPAKAAWYKERASVLGAVVWQRGILATKGPGICHGISGSICGLVDLYRSGCGDIWLRRAEALGLFLSKEWPRFKPLADRPFSLYEGVGGAYYALSMLVMERSRPVNIAFETSFPCY